MASTRRKAHQNSRSGLRMFKRGRLTARPSAHSSERTNIAPSEKADLELYYFRIRSA